jgi:predicted enzyme related to lactoylglutathione lyase
MTSIAARVYHDPADIALIESRIVELDDEARVELGMSDGRRLRGTVTARPSMQVFRDAQGAVFGVLASSGGDPADDPIVDGDVYWLDLFTPDPAAAAAFYAEVAGYEVGQGKTRMGLTRWYLVNGSVARAGILQQPNAAGLAPAWLPYILVDNVAGTVERAVKAGGKVLIAPNANRLNGNLAIIADPNGGVIGVVNAP